MKTTAQTSSIQALKIAFFVLTMCVLLFLLDYETTSILDVFRLDNLAALALYFIPTFLICLFLHGLFIRGKKPALVYSLLIGIPLSFGMMILILGMFM